MLIKSPMQFALTDSERKAVIALKEACEEQGVEYRHTFDLAKTVLVSHSVADDSDPGAMEIRLQTALKRLKNRNLWIKKHGLDSIDAHAALLEVDQEAPGYFVSRFTKDKEDRVIVACHHAFAPTSYVFKSKANRAKWHAAETYRLDLAAADMEEARKGIALASITEDKLTMKRAFRFLKLLTKAGDNMKDMHANRIKKIYSEVPSFLVHLVATAKLLLPAKIAERVCLVSSMEELHKYVDLADGAEMSLDQWASERLERYKETLDKLTL